MINLTKQVTQHEFNVERELGQTPDIFARCLLTTEALDVKSVTFALPLLGTNETCKVQKSEVRRLLNARVPLKAKQVDGLEVILSVLALDPSELVWGNYIVAAPSQLLKPEFKPFIKPERLIKLKEWANG